MSPAPAIPELAPESYDEAAEMLRDTPSGAGVRFRGGGTKLGWGQPVRDVDRELSTTRLDTVLEHNEGDFTVIVQAGVRLADLQAALRSKGQRLALDPPIGEGSEATIGGIAACADAGPLRHRYGSPRELILGSAVALSNGAVARSGGKVIKNVAGYDLGKLYAGSFGTLGLILELALRLHPLPPRTVTVLGRSADPDRIAAAARALADAPLEPEALDVRWIGGEGAVLVMLAGDAAEALATRARSLLDDAGLEAETADDGDAPWATQRAGQRSAEGAVAKVSATATRLPDVLRAAERHGAAVVGRAAHGVSWMKLGPRSDAELVESVASLRRELAPSPCAVLDAPEAIRERIDAFGLEAAPERALMSSVKNRLDPLDGCNPGLFGEAL